MKRLLLLTLCAAIAGAQSFSASASVDAQTEKAIADGLFPGAVVLVGQNGRIVYRKAYGQKSLVPSREPMSIDTIFDVASLTKVVAATPAMMKLVETGRVRLDDPVTAYLPEFQGGTSDITVRDLMIHFSGLRPDLDLEPVWSGYETGIKKALADKPTDPRGAKFVYSDINFELLGEIVQRVSGQNLSEFTQANLFQPLAMRETGYLPGDSLRARAAPTPVCTRAVRRPRSRS